MKNLRQWDGDKQSNVWLYWFWMIFSIWNCTRYFKSRLLVYKQSDLSSHYGVCLCACGQEVTSSWGHHKGRHHRDTTRSPWGHHKGGHHGDTTVSALGTPPKGTSQEVLGDTKKGDITGSAWGHQKRRHHGDIAESAWGQPKRRHHGKCLRTESS